MHLNAFKFLEKMEWKTETVIRYMDIFTDGPLGMLNPKIAPSLLYHACEVFIPELNKAITKPIPSSVFTEMIVPFLDVLAYSTNKVLVNRVVEEFFVAITKFVENENEENDDEENVELPPIVYSCNFEEIFEKLEYLLSEDSLTVSKNVKEIEKLIDIYEKLVETTNEPKTEENEEEEEESEEVKEEKEDNDKEEMDIDEVAPKEVKNSM